MSISLWILFQVSAVTVIESSGKIHALQEVLTVKDQEKVRFGSAGEREVAQVSSDEIKKTSSADQDSHNLTSGGGQAHGLAEEAAILTVSGMEVHDSSIQSDLNRAAEGCDTQEACIAECQACVGAGIHSCLFDLGELGLLGGWGEEGAGMALDGPLLVVSTPIPVAKGSYEKFY